MPAFSTIVIGKGLVGAAAAKYLAATQPGVAVIGPDEPTDYATATVFASHYDQARVLRRIGRDAISTRLNADAAREYPAIQAVPSVPQIELMLTIDPPRDFMVFIAVRVPQKVPSRPRPA